MFGRATIRLGIGPHSSIGDILVLLANFLPGNVTTYTVTLIVGLSINIVFIKA